MTVPRARDGTHPSRSLPPPAASRPCPQIALQFKALCNYRGNLLGICHFNFALNLSYGLNFETVTASETSTIRTELNLIRPQSLNYFRV